MYITFHFVCKHYQAGKPFSASNGALGALWGFWIRQSVVSPFFREFSALAIFLTPYKLPCCQDRASIVDSRSHTAEEGEQAGSTTHCDNPAGRRNAAEQLDTASRPVWVPNLPPAAYAAWLPPVHGRTDQWRLTLADSWAWSLPADFSWAVQIQQQVRFGGSWLAEKNSKAGWMLMQAGPCIVSLPAESWWVHASCVQAGSVTSFLPACILQAHRNLNPAGLERWSRPVDFLQAPPKFLHGQMSKCWSCVRSPGANICKHMWEAKTMVSLHIWFTLGMMTY